MLGNFNIIFVLLTALLGIIERLRGIMVTPEQAQSLSEKWGIDIIVDTAELSQVC